MFRVLITSEITLACVLLIMTGLMVKGVVQTTAREYSFEPEGVLTARLDLREFDYPDPAARHRFLGELQDRLAGQPGVSDVVVASRLPGLPGGRSFELRARPGEVDSGHTGWLVVSPSFFPAFRAELLQGRILDSNDTLNAPSVAVVNTDFADRFLSGGEILGRRVRLEDPDRGDPWVEIVGLVRDGGVFGPEHEIAPGLYLPLAQVTPTTVAIALRTETDPLTRLTTLRQAVAAMDRDLPLYEVMSLGQAHADEDVEERTLGALFATFGSVALIMAVVGLFGVISFGVKKRSKEFGIRRALGAGTVSVIRVVLREAVVPLSLGVAIGTGLALRVAPAMGGVLLGVSPTDPSVYLAVTGMLVVSALGAALAPSVRATRIQPAVALRDN